MPRSDSLFVDTSGWADPVLLNSTEHAAMLTFYRRVVAENRPMVTTNYVLAELIALLTARSRAPRAQVLALASRIRTAPNVRVIHIDPELDVAAWELLDRYSDKAWSLADAASFVVMRRLGLRDAITTDRHFRQAGFQRVPEPAE